MRYLFGFVCLLVLGVMGCGETAGTGGSGGAAGMGGDGGRGGTAGSGGIPECQTPEDCDDYELCTTEICADAMCQHTALQDGTECFTGGPSFDVPGLCVAGSCVPECEGLEDGTECLIRGWFFDAPGLCVAGSCVPECEVLEEGSACNLGDEIGVCANGSCGPRCDNDADCTDYKDCTADTCLSNGLCESVAVQDGTLCAGGTCQSGECVLETLVLPCTEQGIRNAIAAGGDEPYTFGCVGPTTVTTAAVIFIDNDVILDGEGKLSVDGDGDHNVFLVTEGATAELRGFVVTNGADQGGGIFNKGNLTVENSTVSGNKGCNSCSGGGIRNEGTLMLTSSTVSGNNSETGAGIHNDNFATATVMNSTVSGNIGGGLYNDGGTLTVTNTTVSGNTGGFGIRNGLEGALTVMSTVVDGACTHTGGATVTSNGYNIESPGYTCGFNETGDLFNITEEQLDLGELAANGGPTMTHALGAGSVAIDHIPAVDCGVTTDQRGKPRPETGGDACDVGAFEVQP